MERIELPATLKLNLQARLIDAMERTSTIREAMHLACDEAVAETQAKGWTGEQTMGMVLSLAQVVADMVATTVEGRVAA